MTTTKTSADRLRALGARKSLPTDAARDGMTDCESLVEKMREFVEAYEEAEGSVSNLDELRSGERYDGRGDDIANEVDTIQTSFTAMADALDEIAGLL